MRAGVGTGGWPGECGRDSWGPQSCRAPLLCDAGQDFSEGAPKRCPQVVRVSQGQPGLQAESQRGGLTHPGEVSADPEPQL